MYFNFVIASIAQVLSDNPAMARWADAADRVMGTSEGRRREPLGGSASSPLHSRDPSHDDTFNRLVLFVGGSWVQLCPLLGDPLHLGLLFPNENTSYFCDICEGWK